MSKKAFRSQASSSRAFSANVTTGSAFGTNNVGFGGPSASSLSHIYEPPDLSHDIDSNVVVAFKNLQKKDGVTKYKALEELIAFVQEKPIDTPAILTSAFLDTWIALYPRTSVDNTRRVRQLAHQLQGQIGLRCGKRIIKQLPQAIGPWLAGVYDNDKAVSRAARDAFKLVFPSEDKYKAVWRIYQLDILGFVRDVILKESEHTLSDHRITTAEDAAIKYDRTVSAALLVLKDLLEHNTSAELSHSDEQLCGLLDSEKLWKHATSKDALVRRCIYKVLETAIVRRKQDLNPSIISQNVITGALAVIQVNSAYDYTKCLLLVTKQIPSVWTTDYHGAGKKGAKTRLCRFLQRGSLGGPPQFWANIEELCKTLPVSLLVESDSPDNDNVKSEAQGAEILDAIHEGLSSKEEPIANTLMAWRSYLTCCGRLCEHHQSIDARDTILLQNVVPIVSQYILASSSHNRWLVKGSAQKTVCQEACKVVHNSSCSLFKTEMGRISDQLIENMGTSLPEQSKEYSKSQDNIALQASRWYSLCAFNIEEDRSVRTLISKSLELEIRGAITTISNREGKPYGVSAALDSAIRNNAKAILDDPIKTLLYDFANEKIPSLIMSSSSEYLVSILDILQWSSDVRQGFSRSIEMLLQSDRSQQRDTSIRAFLSSPAINNESSLASLIKWLIDEAKREHDPTVWDILVIATQNSEIPETLLQDILSAMISDLSIEPTETSSLPGLVTVGKRDGVLLQNFCSSTEKPQLVSKLLQLSHSSDHATVKLADDLGRTLQNLKLHGNAGMQTPESLTSAIKQNLSSVDDNALSTSMLLTQSLTILEQTKDAGHPSMATNLLPQHAQWAIALNPFFTSNPPVSISLTNPFGSLIRLVSTESTTDACSILRDSQGNALLLRYLLYVLGLFDATDLMQSISREERATLIIVMSVSLELVKDNSILPGSCPLWDRPPDGTPYETHEVMTRLSNQLALLIKTGATMDMIQDVLDPLIKASSNRDCKSYYYGRAFASVRLDAGETHRVSSEIYDEMVQDAGKSPYAFRSGALLTSMSESEASQRLCNEILGTLSGISLGDKDDKALRQLCLLNCLLHSEAATLNNVPQQRLVFFIKHVEKQFMHAQQAAKSEILTALAFALSSVQEIYGSFWSATIVMINTSLRSDSTEQSLPLLGAALRLLRIVTQLDSPNEDVGEAIDQYQTVTAENLSSLMGDLQVIPDRSHQPRQIVNSLLSREIVNQAAMYSDKKYAFYSFLESPSAALQFASFHILHILIPNEQEKLSLDKALNMDVDVVLPDGLLSLIRPHNSSESNYDSLETIEQDSLRSYVFSWKLLFDSWTNASFVLQNDYARCLMQGDYIPHLLQTTFFHLVMSRHKPVDASRYSFEVFEPEMIHNEKDFLGALIHIYYLAMLHVPSAVKGWWRDNASRQLVQSVQSWTEKYISPAVVAKEISAIKTWAATQDKTDENPMTIKVSQMTREITASIPIDEQTTSIAIRLPDSYPLSRAEVISVRRVGVPDSKWQSWIRNAQGQLTTSEGGSNALIDCLLAWKRNVTATMKGQTECAICYSVVGADKTLPKKKCPTCKNSFHSGCLFRWFKSSNSSSCPLCRNTFHY